MTEIPPGAVTTADLYRVMVDMHKDVTRALERLALVDQRNISADQLHTDHEGRLRVLEQGKAGENELDQLAGRVSALERFRYMLAGLMLAAGLVEGAVGYWIGHVLGH